MSDRMASRPSELQGGHWWGAVKRTVAEYRVDNLSDRAAALTYYGVLSIFPALLVLVSAIGLAGHSATQSLLDNLGQLAPGSVRQIGSGAHLVIEFDPGAGGRPHARRTRFQSTGKRVLLTASC